MTLPRPVEVTRMRAIVQDKYGEADEVLRLAEIDKPSIGPDEVLVRVHAAGVDRGVWHLMTGLAYPIRLAGYGLRAPTNRVRGREVAGTVEAVGAKVTTLQPGDAVYGIAEGAFAEYAVAAADLLAPKPADLSFARAAAVPVSAQTALQAVRDHGQVRRGQAVLVIGASGGVGSFAVQIAKAFGAHVTGVASAAKLDLVRSFGVDDVIVDAGGHRSLSRLRRALTPGGTLVIVGSEAGGRWLGGLDRQLRALLLSPFLRQNLRTFVTKENGRDLAALTALIEAGQLAPAVDRVYPLHEAPAAIRYMQEGRVRGKVVVAVR